MDGGSRLAGGQLPGRAASFVRAWLAAGSAVSVLGCFCLLCSTWPDHRDRNGLGDWVAWQEKNRVHLLGWASFRSVKTRGWDRLAPGEQ